MWPKEDSGSPRNNPAEHYEPMRTLTLNEEKERFLQYGIVPKFRMKKVPHKKVQVKKDLLREARWILDTVKKKYGDGASFLDVNFGPRIDQQEAAQILTQYIRQNNVDGIITVHWSSEMTCSARMIWRGPHLKRNRPEDRKYSLVIKDSMDNQYLRERGIRCLADHEIGTHFYRMWNDGLQPWFSDRANFGMHKMSSRESQVSEEGLAAINTVLHSGTKMLWFPALIYYTACMSEEMTFRELFDHLEIYVPCCHQRFKHVMRCKRAVENPVTTGGVGNDQCYFQEFKKWTEEHKHFSS